MKLVEFLYFYLMPETPNSSALSAPSTAVLQRSPSKHAFSRSVNSFGGGGGGEDEDTKTTEEKQSLLGKYLNNVEDLVEDLRESAPFGAALA